MTDDPRCGCSELRSQHVGPDGACICCRCPGWHDGHEIVDALINEKWPLRLPDYRAYRPSWAWHEAGRLAAMHSVIRPGDVVFEVGAEEGDYGALFTSWGAQVVLVEPNPWCWPSIKASMEANGAQPFAWLVGFLADHEWKNDTRQEPRFGRGNAWPDVADEPLIAEHGFQHIAEHADVTGAWTLDHLARTVGAPAVVSIDVEGGELHVLHGASVTLAEARPVVFVSVHAGTLRDWYGTEPEEIYTFMADLGYQGTHLATDHEEHVMFTHPQGRRV